MQATVQLGGAVPHQATRWQHMQVKLIERKGGRTGREEGRGGRKEGGSTNRADEKREGRFLKSQWLGVRIKKAITVHETASGLFIGHYGLRGRLDGLIIEKY